MKVVLNQNEQTILKLRETILRLGELRSELENQITDTQLALCDVYELMEGNDG